MGNTRRGRAMEADAGILLGTRIASMLSSNGVFLVACRIPSIHSGSVTFAILSLGRSEDLCSCILHLVDGALRATLL